MAGEWKTIEQRERSQRKARGTARRGALNASLGVTAATVADIQRPGSLRRARKAGGYLLSRSRPERLTHGSNFSLETSWRGPDEPFSAGLRRRGRYLHTVAHKSPHTAIAGAGALLAGYGATRWAEGRSRDAYQQSRINSRRRSNAAKPITKGMFPLRRSAKAAGPVIREGITRAGRVGVSYEHKGTTAWGLNASAARANWEVSRVSQAPAARVSRPQPRFGSGGSGGRRIIEKADTSGRKPTIARTGGKTPAGGAQKQQPRPSVVDGPVIARGKVTGIVPMATGQQMTTGQQEQTGTGFGKADRYYDPEDRRQRRIGATAATAALGGGALGYSGGKELATTGSLSRLKDPQLRLSRMTPVEGPLLPHRKRRSVRADMVPNQVDREEMRALRGVHVTPRAAGKVGGGVALLAVAGRLARRGDDPRKRRWN